MEPQERSEEDEEEEEEERFYRDLMCAPYCKLRSSFMWIYTRHESVGGGANLCKPSFSNNCVVDSFECATRT